jgi:hypothetical protein
MAEMNPDGVPSSQSNGNGLFKPGIEEALPRVFNVELTDDALTGLASRGDTLTISRDVVPVAGVLLRAGDAYVVRQYFPEDDGAFTAVARSLDYPVMHSIEGLHIIGVVTGTPHCRWSDSRDMAHA